jgi:hypothetical protein
MNDTGNEWSSAELAAFNSQVDLEALPAYRQEVGRSTCRIASCLIPVDLRRKVEPANLTRIREEGGVRNDTLYLTDYWGKRTVAELLLMPASRYLLLHLNEALEIKKEMAKAS